MPAAEPQATRTALDPVPASRGAAAGRTAGDPLQLTGEVVAPDSAALGGAHVELLLRDADGFWCIDLELGRRVEPVAVATTGADGAFAFTVQRGRPYRVRVRARGFAVVERTQCLGGQHLRVVLQAGAALEGTVVESGTRRPLAGVHVRAFEPGVSNDLWATQTDATGRYRLDGLRAARHYVAVRSDAHQVPDWADVVLVEGRTLHRHFELVAGSSILGTVVDAATQAPIAGAEVSESWTFDKSARTDARGRYRLRGAPSDERGELYVRAAGYGSQTGDVQRTGADLRHDFTLQPGACVTGRVVASSGQPLAGVYVAAAANVPVAGGIGTDWLAASTGADGRFRVGGVGTGKVYTLYLRAPGFGLRVYDLPAALQANETYPAGEFVLHREGRIEGQVTDSDGVPLAGVTVGLSGLNDDHRRLHGQQPPRAGRTAVRHAVAQVSSRSQTTGPDGWFRFAMVAGGTHLLTVRRPGRTQADASKDVTLAEGDERTDVCFSLAVGHRVVVTLRTPRGPLEPGTAHAALESSPWQTVASSRADAQGRFVFEDVPAGSYGLRCEGGPDDWVLPVVENVRVPGDDVVAHAQPAAWIEGSALGAGGEPLVGWHVRGKRSGTQPKTQRVFTTDARGRFRLKAPAGELWDVIVQSPERSPYARREARADGVAAGTNDLVVRVP
jgi:protocatechuate 3,4-dioxygenase beta subunit